MVSIFAVGFTTGIEISTIGETQQQEVTQISVIKKQQKLMEKIGHNQSATLFF